MGITTSSDPDLRARSRSSLAPILGITLTIAALFQMLVYALVVLYSLLFGGIDLVIPAKSGFLAVIFVVGLPLSMISPLHGKTESSSLHV